MWAELVKDLTDAEDVLSKVETITGLEDLYFRKGQLERMRYFLGFEDMVKRLLEQENEVEDAEML